MPRSTTKQTKKATPLLSRKRTTTSEVGNEESKFGDVDEKVKGARRDESGEDSEAEWFQPKRSSDESDTEDEDEEDDDDKGRSEFEGDGQQEAGGEQARKSMPKDDGGDGEYVNEDNAEEGSEEEEGDEEEDEEDKGDDDVEDETEELANAAIAPGEDGPTEADSKASAKAAKVKARELAKYAKFGEKLARRGVVYLARVPPFMKPEKVRVLLERYGPISRLYLAPEDAAVARRRKKLGGQRNTNYTEGWIEFEDKKVAKRVARGLHMTPMGGKKRAHYGEDMWSLRYLKHFTWSHLTEKKAYERRVREHRLKLEMVAAKKQNDEFRELVDRTKAQRGIERRKRDRAAASDAAVQQPENGGDGGDGGDGGGGGGGGRKRRGGGGGGSQRALGGALVAGSGVSRGSGGGGDRGDGGGGDAALALEQVKRRFHQHAPLRMDGGGQSANTTEIGVALMGRQRR